MKSILIKFIDQSHEQREQLRVKTRSLIEKHYNWKDIAKKWEKYLDTIPSKQSEWNRPAKFLTPIDPSILNENLENVNYMALMTNICTSNLKNINLISSKRILNILQHLEYGYVQQGPSVRNYSLKEAVQELNMYIQNINNAEKARTSNYESEEDYIKYSKIKAST